MTRHFRVKVLVAERVDDAFPVARAAVPDLTLERWRQFARLALLPAAAPTASGILVVENPRGYIQGFCTYRLQHDIRHGTTMAVDDLIAIDLLDSAPIAAALLEALEARARATGCDVLQLHVPDLAASSAAASGLYEHLRQAGHAVDALRLAKPMDRPAR